MSITNDEIELIRRCSSCGNISLQRNFYKDTSRGDVLYLACNVCRIEYYNEKREQKNEYQKFCAKQNRAKKSLYEKNKRKTNLNIILACNLRSKANKAFKSQNVENLNKTFDLVGCSQSLFKRCILQQIYGDMTGENYGSVWTIDPCYSLSKTNLSDKNGMNKSTCWI